MGENLCRARLMYEKPCVPNHTVVVNSRAWSKKNSSISNIFMQYLLQIRLSNIAVYYMINSYRFF